MPFFQVDDHAHANRKMLALAGRMLAGDRNGLAALGMWTLAGSRSQDVGTDGVVSLQALISIGYDSAAVQELAHLLVEQGLWHAAGHSCRRCEPVPTQDPESGIAMPCWRFHDWWAMKYDPAKVVRENRAKRGELQNPAVVDAVWLRDCVDPTDPTLRGHAHCRYCDRLVKRKDRSSKDMDARPMLDHVDPYQAAGVRNLVVSCAGCNRHKGQRTPAEAGMSLRPAPRRLSPEQEAAAEAAGAATEHEPEQSSSSSAPEQCSSSAPEVSSGGRAGTRAHARPGQGQGQGQVLGSGPGSGSGSGSGSGPGSGSAPAPRRRNRRRGRGGSPTPKPDRAPELDAGAAPPAPTVGQFGSPWYGYRGPRDPLGDESTCPTHHQPLPCRKCTNRGESQ